jgi:hypothetical protein
MMFTSKVRFLTAALSALALLIGAGSAHAASPTTGDRLTVPLGSKSSGLRASGVKLKAIKPATLTSKTLKLEVSDVTLPAPGTGQLILRGGVTLSKGKKKLEVKGFLVSIKPASIKLTAKVGGSRFTVFEVKKGAVNSLDTNASAVKVAAPKLVVGSAAAKAIKKALGLKSYKPKTLGTLTGSSTAYYPPISKSKPGDGSPAHQELWDEPVLPTRPPTAVDATSPALEWWSRDSWVNYVGNTPQVIGGATSLGVVYNDPSQGAPAHKCPSNSMQAVSNVYGFGLPFTGGWWDSASGTGVLTYGGGARFYYPGRFDLSFSNAEVVITPSGTTMNMSVVDSDYPTGRRAWMFNVDTASPLSGGPFTPGSPAALLRNRISSVGASGPFGGMYGVNLDWGCISAQFSV